MSKVLEIFGFSTKEERADWDTVIREQHCPYLGKKCYKTRKSDPDISIGTCTVLYGRKDPSPILICPGRLIERKKIFVDCMHLLTTHEPGNELHLISEVSIPGGSVDYFVVSAKNGKVKDFVGVELQTLDTTGTVWPERQRLLKNFGIARQDDSESSSKPFGMNWKMTAKTILVQMHHKVETFEHINKKLVLVVQKPLLDYMQREFNFDHLANPALIGDSMHLHAYDLSIQSNDTYTLNLDTRISTDAEGISLSLGLQAEAKVELEQIIGVLESKLSPLTLFSPV